MCVSQGQTFGKGPEHISRNVIKFYRSPITDYYACSYQKQMNSLLIIKRKNSRLDQGSNPDLQLYALAL